MFRTAFKRQCQRSKMTQSRDVRIINFMTQSSLFPFGGTRTAVYGPVITEVHCSNAPDNVTGLKLEEGKVVYWKQKAVSMFSTLWVFSLKQTHPWF